jgi:hypothetical protein
MTIGVRNGYKYDRKRCWFCGRRIAANKFRWHQGRCAPTGIEAQVDRLVPDSCGDVLLYLALLGAGWNPN